MINFAKTILQTDQYKHVLISMKKLLFAFLALLVSTVGYAADVTGALTNVASPTITYQSVDVNNNPITLSAKIYYKNNQTVSFIMLNCHATITHDAGCPTGAEPQMEAIKYMVSENCLLICPDYIGFGESKDKTHPYMCTTITSRNLLDCFKAAVKYVKETGKRSIAANYYTMNVGYSQGGSTALAFQKYLETEATEADRKLVNLRGSICGAGAYDQNMVFDTYEQWCAAGKTLDYPIYMYYLLNGHKATYGNSTMKDLELQECFTPEFWNYLQSGFKAKFEAKATNVDTLNAELKRAGFETFYSIINASYANHSSKVYRIIRKTLEHTNLLKKDGWTPATPVIFYHTKATTPATGQDIVVPYACTQAALERFAGHCSYVDAIDDYKYSVSGVNSLWHCAVFRENLPKEYGSANRFTEGIVMGLAGITGNVSYKFSQLDHRTFGARFYAQILSLQLRPATTSTTGNANSTNIDPVTTLTSLDVPAGAASQQGAYDRVKTAFLYPLPQGKPVFVQFAGKVDGYAFGIDAPRYEVEVNGDGEAVGYTVMDDMADFEAGKVYLVGSEKAGIQEVLSERAGALTKTVGDALAWRELNIRKLSVNGESSFGTGYMPFAYVLPEELHAFAIVESEKAGYVRTKKMLEVPAATGVLLENVNAENSTVLEPLLDGSCPEGESMLTGSYTAIPNNGHLFFGFNKTGDMGFYTYSSVTTIPAYYAYLPNGSNVKGCIISMEEDDEADAISAVIKSEQQDEAVYGMDGTVRSSLQHGVNIVRKADGSVKKVLKR